MNFKLKFLCILFLNFLPQSFASPKNSRSRRVDDFAAKVKQLKEELKSLHVQLLKEKVNLKSNKPPSKTTEEERTLSTKEKELTASPLTPSKNNAIKSLLKHLTNNANVGNTTSYSLTTPSTAPLSLSSSLDKTTVTTKKTTVTTKKTTATKEEAKRASSNPVTHATVNSKDDVLDKLEYLQAAEESLGKLKLERQIENGASLAISVRDHQIGDKTSGDNFLNHENGQRGNYLSGRNGDDENGQNEKGLTGKNGDDEDGEKAEGLTRKNGDGEDGHKVEGVTGKNGDGEDGDKVEGVTGKNGDGEDGDKVEGVTGKNGDGEDGHKEEGVVGRNGDGEDGHKVEGVIGKNGDGEDGDKVDGLTGKNGDGEDGHKVKGVTGKNGDGEDGHKEDGLTGKNGDGEDGQKEERLTGEKGDDEARQKGKGSPGQNGDGEDGHKEKGLTGNNGDGEDGEKGKGLPGENGDGTREEEPPLNQATGEDNNTNKQIPYSSRRGLEEHVNGGDFRLKDRKSGVYGDSDSYEHTLSHFAGFIVTSIVIVFAVYAVHHNRQKIVAIIIEGRNDNRSRKLETNMEEAMPAMKNTHSTYVYQNL